MTVYAEGGKPFVRTAPCEPGAKGQTWTVDLARNRVRHTAFGNYCLTYAPSQPGAMAFMARCAAPGTPTGEAQWFGNCPAPVRIKLRTPSLHYLSEFYRGLYADVERRNKNEVFVYSATTLTFQAQSNHECLDAYADSTGAYHLHTYPCDARNRNQKWKVDASKRQVRHAVHPNLCLADALDTIHQATVAPCDTTAANQHWIVQKWGK
ncbi:hypothetical protein ACHHYP_08691 [Achlya hypogyna]|uniref:Ricin B lectin domain-containing protein n=1 Tax=Achlya hypogyna TaxID=1202772 RepID=A0A1V9YP71_ACHHY|nr:hypothetical protein ACHHYP_08691 [Achlya hypogyna]